MNKVPHFPLEWRERVENSIGGPNAWIDSYGLLAISKLRFYSERCAKCMNDSHPWGELRFPLERAKRWAPLNRGIWIAARVLLAGHLLQAKGDRVAMHSSVEVRYPFLDEDVFDFTARLHPRWKLRGFRDKYLLRLLAERWIPKSDRASRQSDLPRAARQFSHGPGAAVRGAASERRIAAPDRLFRCRRKSRTGAKVFAKCAPDRCRGSPSKWVLTAVVATQLWHHQFMGGGLADMPEWTGYEKALQPA